MLELIQIQVKSWNFITMSVNQLAQAARAERDRAMWTAEQRLGSERDRAMWTAEQRLGSSRVSRTGCRGSLPSRNHGGRVGPGRWTNLARSRRGAPRASRAPGAHRIFSAAWMDIYNHEHLFLD
jgi:hypothetical protein